MSNNGPTFTKATYDAKQLKYDPPSPGRLKAARTLQELDAATSRAAHKEINRMGFTRWVLDRLKER